MARPPASPDVWMPWFIADYMASTMSFSTEEHGAYLLLLAAYWMRQGPLPDEDQELARIVRLSPQRWAKIRPTIARRFVVENGLWRNVRADREIQHAVARVSARQRGGRAASAARHNHRQHTAPGTLPVRSASTEHHAQGTLTVIPPPPPPPPPENSTPLPPSGVGLEAGGEGLGNDDLLRKVEAVWAIWPKKVETLAGQRAIAAAIHRDGFDRVLAGTRAIADANARRQTVPPGRFLKGPVEFFDGSMYLDDPAQYGPRSEALDVETARRILAEKVREAAEHPGNPGNTVGSLEKKQRERPAYQALVAAIAELRRQIGGHDDQE